MRIAAGVLLLVAAGLNLFGGLTWTVLGGVGAAAGAAADKSAKDIEDKDIKKAAKESGSEAKSFAGKFLPYGVFLLVLTGLEIAAAVMLFKAIKPTFIMVTGVLEIIADGTGIALIGGGYVSPTIGAVAAIFAIIAALGIKGSAAAGMPEPEEA